MGDSLQIKRRQFDLDPDDPDSDSIRIYWAEDSPAPPMPSVLEDGGIKCHQCESIYTDVVQHWQMGSCSHPKLTKQTKEVLTGLCMGDGTIGSRDKGNPYMEVGMISEKFLNWLDKKLDWLTTGVSLRSTAKEQAQSHRKSGWNEDAREENYHDTYRLRTRSHPWLNELSDWYKDNGKKFPNDLKLTPLITKFWYVSDGGLHWQDYMDNPRIRFGVRSQKDRGDYFKNLFEEIGFDATMHNTSVTISSYQTEELLEWMGPAPAGFEYKWQNESMCVYKHMKEAAYE